MICRYLSVNVGFFTQAENLLRSFLLKCLILATKAGKSTWLPFHDRLRPCSWHVLLINLFYFSKFKQDRDDAPRFAEFDCIGQEVGHDLHIAEPVTQHFLEIDCFGFYGEDGSLKFNLALSCEQGDLLESQADQLTEVEVLLDQGESVIFKLCVVHEVP